MTLFNVNDSECFFRNPPVKKNLSYDIPPKKHKGNFKNF